MMIVIMMMMLMAMIMMIMRMTIIMITETVMMVKVVMNNIIMLSRHSWSHALHGATHQLQQAPDIPEAALSESNRTDNCQSKHFGRTLE